MHTDRHTLTFKSLLYTLLCAEQHTHADRARCTAKRQPRGCARYWYSYFLFSRTQPYTHCARGSWRKSCDKGECSTSKQRYFRDRKHPSKWLPGTTTFRSLCFTDTTQHSGSISCKWVVLSGVISSGCWDVCSKFSKWMPFTIYR